MTPMIDVVFLLIIFFLVSSNLAQRETRLELDLPPAESDARTTTEQKTEGLVVNVTATGETLLGDLPVTPIDLVGRLRAEAAQRGAPPRVRLRGDRNAPYAAIEPALAACAEAGVADIDLGTKDE
jgi:biopolymer transport protein ExbD